MSHDSHGHNASAEAEAPEPIQIPLAPPRAYLWPLGLSLVVAALLVYVLLIMDHGLNSPPDVGRNTGMTTVTLTATAEPSAVALSNPTSTMTPIAEPSLTEATEAMATQVPTVIADTPGPVPSNTSAVASPTSLAGSISTPVVSPPVNLDMEGSSFTVEAALQDKPTWKFNPDPTRASWLPTTAEPYVIGIPYSAANAALFTAARPGQVVSIRNALGVTLRFKVQTVTRVAADSIGSLQRERVLGLNLYLLADPASDRAMITATFLDASGGSADQ